MTNKDFDKIESLLMALYPQSRRLEGNGKYAYWLVLKDFTFDDVKDKVLTYAKTGKYFPDVSDICPTVVEIKTEKKYEDVVAKELEKLSDKVRKLGGVCRIVKAHGSEPMSIGALADKYKNECVNCTKKCHHVKIRRVCDDDLLFCSR